MNLALMRAYLLAEEGVYARFDKYPFHPNDNHPVQL